jgi:hypothetical protein
MELSCPLELAKSLLARETLKKEAAMQSQAVWEKRLAFVDANSPLCMKRLTKSFSLIRRDRLRDLILCMYYVFNGSVFF